MMLRWWRRLNRAEALATAFPDEYRPIVDRVAPLVRYLEPEDREKLEALIRIFLSEKEFEAAGGLELTDEMRVAIAARACLLILRRVDLDAPIFPDLDVVIVYPNAYRAKQTEHDGHIVIESEQHRLGESWQRGMVVLSWNAVKTGALNPSDGHDVVLHEFAHQLDAEDGGMDGAPQLENREQYRIWAQVFGHDYRELHEQIEHHRKSSIDPYAATNPAEFFAVVSEAFFEKPAFLKRKHPEVYAELAAYFRIDPAELMLRDVRTVEPRSAD
jgi:Mlc titration factor MtfA (ptsG expression regulator)